MKTTIVLKSACFTLFSLWFLCLLSRANAEENMPANYNPNAAMKRYRNWLSRHNRKYSSRDEWELRFGIYQSNVEIIDYINSQNLSYKLTDNKFADMTNEEFSTIYLGYKNPQISNQVHNHTSHKTQNLLPTSVDWRTQGSVTPIKDQGRCGTLFSFSFFVS